MTVLDVGTAKVACFIAEIDSAGGIRQGIITAKDFDLNKHAVDKGRVVTDPAEKERALECIVEHIVPGRTRDAREPSASELAATSVIALTIDEASAKSRNEPPVDLPADLTRATWAGVLPIAQHYGPPIADSFVPAGLEPAETIASYERPRAAARER